MLANVTTIAEQFSFEYPEGRDPVSGRPVPWSASLSAVKAALARWGFPDKEGRALAPRHAFLRAIRAWIVEQGGSVDHSISDLLDTLVAEDFLSLTIQLDAVVRDETTRTAGFVPRGRVSVDKGTGRVSATDAAAQAQLSAVMPKHFELRRAPDITRLVNRLMSKSVGALGLIPWGGRGTYFVLSSNRAQLDALCGFLSDIGVKTYRSEQYQVIPVAPGQGGAPAAQGGSTLTAQGSSVGNVAQVQGAFADALQNLMLECIDDVRAVNGEVWDKKGCLKNRREATRDKVQYALDTIRANLTLLADKAGILIDYFAMVGGCLDSGAVPVNPFAPPVVGSCPIAPPVNGPDALPMEWEDDGSADDTTLETEAPAQPAEALTAEQLSDEQYIASLDGSRVAVMVMP